MRTADEEESGDEEKDAEALAKYAFGGNGDDESGHEDEVRGQRQESTILEAAPGGNPGTHEIMN